MKITPISLITLLSGGTIALLPSLNLQLIGAAIAFTLITLAGHAKRQA